MSLTPGARGEVGETHSWMLNDDGVMQLSNGFFLDATMHFEVQDHGQSRGNARFSVKTRAYLYALETPEKRELVSAHWHPTGKSDVAFPHWHLGVSALSESGVWLKRAHIPSNRVSLEQMIRVVVEADGAQPVRDDWKERLSETEETFKRHASWLSEETSSES